MSNSTRCIRTLAILLFVTSIAADDPPKKSASPSSKPAAKSTAKPAAKPATKPKSGKAAANSTVPTEKECAAYGKALVAAINQNDREALQRFMDWNELLKRATQVSNVSQKFRDDYIAATKASLESDNDILTKLAEAVSNGARFSYCRCVRQGNERLAQFRRILPNKSLDYFSILLRKRPDRTVVGVDLKTLSSGDFVSKIMRESFLAGAAAVSRGLPEHLKGTDLDFVKNMNEVIAMNKLFSEAKYPEALAIYDKLPPTVQKMRSTQLVRVMTAQQSGNQETHVSAMEDFRAAFPDDPSVDFLSIDYYFQCGKLDEAIDAIDRTAASVGNDPYFGILKANVLIKKGDLPAARKAISATRKAEPSLIDAHWVSITVALAEKDFAAVAQLLDGIAKRFHRDFNDLGTIPEYAEFVASPEGKAWQKSYAEAKSATAAEMEANDK